MPILDGEVFASYIPVFDLHGMLFSTFDHDNDNFFTGNCANEFGGGWWCIF